MTIEFPKAMGYPLSRLINRTLDGQVVHVWMDGTDYAFSFHDEPMRLPKRDWVCIGELEWRVEGDKFVYELQPLAQRSEQELKERAEKTAAHRAYREELWRRYPLSERLADLGLAGST